MSEKTPREAQQAENRFETIAGYVEGSLIDPRMQAIIDKATVYDEYLRTYPLPPHRRSHMVHELDDEWKEWIKAPITITGKILPLYNGEADEAIDVIDAAGISNGFDIRTFARDEEEERNPELRLGRLMYDFFISGEYLSEKYNNATYYHAHALIGEVILQTDVPSVERALMWLEASSPYFIEEIDRRITSSRSTEDAILALRGLQIDACLDVEDDLTRNSAEIYLNQMIQIDKEVHYDTYLSGITYSAVGGDTMYPLYRKLHGLSKLDALTIGSNETTNGVRSWDILLPAEVVYGDVSTETLVCDIPLDSIVLLRSGREALLGNDFSRIAPDVAK